MPKIRHHIAKLPHFLRVGAVRVFGGCLRMRQTDDMKREFCHKTSIQDRASPVFSRSVDKRS